MTRSDPRPGAADGLNPDDPGMTLLREAIDIEPARVLSLCSGDLRGRARTELVLDRRNMGSGDGARVPLALGDLEAAHERFDLAVLWPRAHLGKDFTLQCVATGLLALRSGGRLLCAVKKQKGAQSIGDFMASVFGNVRTLSRERGYRLLQSTVGPQSDRGAARDALKQRYLVTDPLLGELELETAPGVFSRKALDAGTRSLIEVVARRGFEPKRVVDLCAGWGPLGLWAGQRWPQAQVLLVESSFIATELVAANIERAGMGERVAVVGCVGLPASREDGVRWHGTVDLLLVNPPTHADAEALRALFRPISKWLRPQARCLAVASRPEAVQKAFAAVGATTLVERVGRFSVIDAWWDHD